MGPIYSDRRKESKLLGSVNAYKFKAKEMFLKLPLLYTYTQLPALCTLYRYILGLNYFFQFSFAKTDHGNISKTQWG